MMLKILRDAVRLDIYDLNYAFSSEQFGLLSLPLQWRFVQKGVLLRGIAFFWNLLKSLRTLRLKRQRRLPRNHVIFFVYSRNNRDALLPLHHRISQSSMIGVEGKETLNIPLYIAHAISLFFLPRLVLEMLKARGYRRRSFSLALDAYLETYGFYIVCRRILRRLAPAAVVVSNDHNFWNRTIVKAAQDEGILTFYVQHASVTEKFPPLAFDYACLDGEDALLKYDDSGPSETKVFLTGMPKFDAHFSSLNTSNKVETVGICTNEFDSLESVRDLFTRLRQSAPWLTLVLRPHPSDRRVSEWFSLAADSQLRISDSRKEGAFEFLKGIDVVVAGETGLLLEAALMNVYPIYFDYEGLQLDFYGFLRHGLVDRRVSEPYKLCSIINSIQNNRPAIRTRAKYYCETVGTPYDGRSAKLCSHIITALSRGEKVDMANWDPVPDLKNLQAYSPR